MSKKYTADILDSTIENGYGRINLGQWGVGIGSATNPRAGIETDSDAILKNGVWINNNSSVYFADTVNNYGTSYAYIWGNGNAGTSFLAFDTNAGRAMTIDNSRNVGIGTTSPRAALDITGLGMMFGYSSTNAAERDWLISTNYASYGDFVIRQSNAKDGNPYSDGTTRLAIDSSGNVGINKSNPGSLLHLKGLTNQVGITLENPQSRTYQIFSNGSTGGGGVSSGSFAVYDFTAAADRFVIDSSGNVGIGESPIGTGASVSAKTLEVSHSNVAALSVNYTGATGKKYDIVADSLGFAIWDDSNSAYRMRIDSSGNVGIGTGGSIDSKLHIEEQTANTPCVLKIESLSWDSAIELKNGSRTWEIGNDYSDSGSLFIYDGTAGSERMRINSSGNVGIGVSPSVEMHIKKDSNVRLRLESDNTGTSTLQFADQDDGNVGIIQYDHSVDAMIFDVNASERMRIDSSGNVDFKSGILGCAPTDSFTLNGKTQPHYGFNLAPSTGVPIGISGYYGISLATAGTERMRIDSSGNVGIGTSNPSEKLEVRDGNIRVTTSSSFSKFKSGRASVPSAIGFNLGGLGFDAYSTGTTYVTGAQIESFSEGAWSSTSAPSYLSFQTVPSGSTSLSERMRIDSSGNVTMYNNLYCSNIITNSGDLSIDSGGSGNNILFKYGGTERMRITAAGNVGIGTTSPSVPLEVNVGLNSLKISGRDTYIDSTIDSANANIYVTQAGVGDFSQEAGHLVLQARTQGTVYRDIIFAGGLANGEALMTINGQGNVGIGTSPSRTFHVHTPTATDIHLTTTASGTSSTDGATISLSGTQMIINQRENDVMRFQTNTTERMRITSGGDVLIGKQSLLNSHTGVWLEGANSSDGGKIRITRANNSNTQYPVVFFNTSGGATGSILTH
jgi:hypothetical protein